ncbi:hypothetical protein G9A89_010173 [Geosiphon pyriformis]|nr:hypothetical protein G9A89_010173 [Geosiphon pyriformis]
MAYAPIAKLEKFTSEEDDTQIWLNNIKKTITDTANLWYQNLVNKLQDFNAFKIKFLRYFSNNNSINRLVNTFTTIKQGETKAVTTYLGWFYRNLCQIQAIQADYFTAPQILNQFIRGLHSNILQHIRPMHSINLQAVITNTRDFEATELEANYTQALTIVQSINLHNDTIIKKIQIISKINCIHYHQPINSDNRKHIAILSKLPTYNTAATVSTTSISSANLLTNNTSNLSAAVTIHLLAAVSGNLSAPTNSNTATELISKQNPKAKINPTKLEIINGSLPTDSYLLVTSEDTQPNNLETNQQSTLTSNILPAVIMENKLLDAIFLFKLEEPSITLLFSGATLEEKSITAMYTDAKVNGHFIKLILDNGSAGSIITKQLMDQLGSTRMFIGEINNFFIEVNGIIISIKVLVIEATQYQALIGNNWLFKVNSFNLAKMVDIHTYLPHVDTLNPPSCHQPYLLNLRKKKKNLPEKPTKTQQAAANTFVGQQQQKKAERKTYLEHKREKEKGKAKEIEPLPTAIYTPYTYTPSQ